jgi:alanine dehydrogenase
MLVLTRTEVEELLDLGELREALARAHEELSDGQASLPPRIAALAGDAGLLGAMPGYLPSTGLGCKLVSLFPGNVDRPTHQAAIVLFDPANGSPVALMDGTYITATRTAGAAALAADLLAREDARVLAICGTGVQARSAVRAYAGIRDWREIRIAGRDPAKAAELAHEVGATTVSSFDHALRGADVVHACTHSPDPIVRLEWLAPGTHVGSVGLNPAGSELDPGVVDASLLVVESRESAFAPPPGGAPELAGRDPSAAVELGEVVAGRAGRTGAGELTLYKSVGVAVQDLAAAALVLAAARERGAGMEIELEEIPA